MQKKHIGLAILYMLCIISLSVTLVLNFRPLYYFDIGYLDIAENSGYAKEIIRENYDALIDYNSVFYTKDLHFPSLPMSENGRIHFVEVKKIFVFVQCLAAITLPLCVCLTLYMKKRKEFLFLKYAGILTLAIPVLLGGLIAANWNSFFVTFHHLFFRNDYWLFDPAYDPVILILPDQFFLHAAVMILGCVILGSLTCLFLSRKWKNSQTL